MTDLSALLVAARGQRTLRSAARLAGVSPRSIAMWEAGSLPKLGSLLRLLDVYGLPLAGRRAILDAHMAAVVS